MKAQTRIQNDMQFAVWFSLLGGNLDQDLRISSMNHQYYTTTGRLFAWINIGGFGTFFTFSVSKDNVITLNCLNIPEHQRRKGYAKQVIGVLKKVQKDTGMGMGMVASPKIIIKYPQNKEFWNHYSAKYGGVKFQYK